MNALFKALGFVICVGFAACACGQLPGGKPAAPPDRAKLAHTLVTQCAGIGEGELVWISGGARDLDLLEDIVIEVRRLGAHPLVALASEPLARRVFTDVPTKFDGQARTFELRLADMIAGRIHVDFRERPDLLADIPPQRLMEAERADYAVEQALLKRGVRQVYVGNGLYPTKALATQFVVPLEELTRIFWNGVNVDYKQLQAVGEKVQKQLAGGNEVKITAPNGTNLTVKITQRPVYVSDGVISEKDRAQGGPACQVWLPAGEVYVTPVPGTANGTFVADHYFFEGKLIEGLKLEFKDGRLTTMTAKGDITPLKQRYDAAPSGRELFGFIDVGINPNVEIPKESRMVTWMAAGTVAVSTGNNAWAGGDNTVPFGLYAQLPGATLMVDGKPVVEKGKLTAGEVE